MKDTYAVKTAYVSKRQNDTYAVKTAYVSYQNKVPNHIFGDLVFGLKFGVNVVIFRG